MKIQKVKNKKLFIFTAIAIVILLAVLCSYYLISTKNTSTPIISPTPTAESPNLSPPSDDEIKAGNQAKDSTVNPSEPPTPTSSTSIQITASSQNGSMYQIRALIEKVVSGGTCNLTLSQGDKLVTKSAPIQTLSQSSTCQGFDIPVSELNVGTWQLKLNITNSNYSGSTSGTIQVK